MTEQYHLDKINETCCLIFVVHNKDLKLKIVIKYYCVNCLRLIRLLIKTKANNVFIFLPILLLMQVLSKKLTDCWH